MTGGTRLRVNPIACDGRSLCAEVFPEMITLDDWGFPVIRDRDVPPGPRPAAGEAARLCLRLALRLDPLESHTYPAPGSQCSPDDENRAVRQMDDLVRGAAEDETGEVSPPS